MTDLEIASAVRLGRRQGFARACGVAFFAAFGSGMVAAFAEGPASAAVIVATAVVVALAIGAFLLDMESGAV